MLPWILMLASIWLPVVYLLGAQWSVYPEYQYGWAVPFLCLFLAWQKLQGGDRKAESAKRKAQSGEQASESGKQKAENEERTRPGCRFPRLRGKFPNFQLPTSIFYALLAAFGLVYWLMRILQEANPIWRAASWGLALSAVAMTLCVLRLARSSPAGAGEDVRRTGEGNARPGEVSLSQISGFNVSAFVFPVCFFLVAVPWPTPLEQGIIQTLSRLNAALVVGVLNFLGVPALQHGNVIEVATGMVGISEACSGIRSFQATLMMALFFGEFFRLAPARRWGLAVAGPALAAGFNFARTFILVFVAARDGLPVMERWHDTTGVAILLGCFFCLWGLAVWMGAGEKSRRQKAESRSQEAESGERKAESGKQAMGSGSAPHAISHALAENPSTSISNLLTSNSDMGSAPAPGAVFRALAENFPTPNSQLPTPKVAFPISALSVVLLVWAVVVEGSTEWWFRSHENRQDNAFSWAARWPVENPTLQTNIIPATALRILQCDIDSSASWTTDDGISWQAFYLRWLPANSFYGRTREALSKCHNPAECLPAAGMKLEQRLAPVSLPVRPNLNLVFDRFEFDAGGHNLYVFFSQTEAMNGGGQINLRTTSLARLRAALAGSRNYGQNNFEVALAGPTSADAALQLFKSRLPELVEFARQNARVGSR